MVQLCGECALLLERYMPVSEFVVWMKKHCYHGLS